MSKDQPSPENSDLAQPSEAAGLMGMLRGVVASDWLAAAQPSEPQNSPPGNQPLDSPKKSNDVPTKPTVDLKRHDMVRLKVRCPHCHNPIEVVDDDPSGDVSCPSCGSCFNLAKDSETARYLDSGRMLGHFQLLDRLGQGAFGEVWKARDTELDRLVAIKFPRREHLTEEETEKFIREARAAAQVRHPNIVSVYEVGRERNLIYIASDFIDGATLDEWVQAHPLTVRETVELCAKIAEALHHAHEAGVVHRDLKPQNILVRHAPARSAPIHGGQDHRPDESGHYEPFITDFGLAKRDAGEITMTVEGAILGTPAYMPPEQARGEAHHADRRSDVYSLGVILFRLLTGELPFRGQRQMLIVQILNEEPPPLRKLDARLPRDVETICLKCLEKDPARRYQSAAALAADLRLWLTGHPIQARPISRTERAWRWCRRNPAVASLSATVVLVLLIGIGVSSYFAVESSSRAQELTQKQTNLLAETRRANQNAIESNANAKLANAKTAEAVENARKAEIERTATLEAKKQAQLSAEAAEAEKTRAQESEARATFEKAAAQKAEYLANVRLYSAQIEQADRALESGDLGRSRMRLGQIEPAFRGWEYAILDRVNPLQLILTGHSGSVNSVSFSPDGKRIVTGGGQYNIPGELKVWDAATGQETLTLKGHSWVVDSVSFSPDGKRIVSGSYDRTLKVWDATTGQETLTLKGHSNAVSSVSFSPDGKRIVSGSYDRTLKVWDATTGQETLTLNGHSGYVISVSFSPDGQRIVSGSSDKTLKVWDAATGQETLTLKGHSDYVSSVSFSPDGQRIVSGSNDNTLKLWDAATGQETLTLNGHSSAVSSVSFSPDGQRIVSGSDDKTLKMWDAATGQETLTLKGHSGSVSSVSFSPDGKRIVSGSSDKTLKVWNASTGHETLTLTGHSGSVNSVSFSPDGKRIVSGSSDKTLKVWNAATGHETLTLKGHSGYVISVSFSPDGQRIVSGSSDKTLKVWDAATGQETLTLKGHSDAVICVSFSPDGQRIVSGSSDKTLKVWNSATGQETLTLKGHSESVFSVSFSPDGTRIVSGNSDDTLKVWDAKTGQETLTLNGHLGYVSSVSFSPDGTRIVSGSDDNTLKMWDAATGQETLTLKGHLGPVSSVTFSPDGKRIVSGSDDNTLKMWDAATGQETLTLKGHLGPVSSVTFSPDGKRIVTGSRDNTLNVWDARPWTLELLAERDALSLIHFLQDQGRAKYKSELIGHISADQTISEIVRQHALQFARELKLNEPNQSMVDASFEKDLGTTWKVQTYLQRPETVRVTAEHAKVGEQSLAIEVKDADDVRCMQYIALKARTRYRLSGWVKTHDVVVVQDGGSTGACLSVEDIGISKSVVGTVDWQQLYLEFDSGDRTEVELGPRLGTNGSICTGTAWFDELSLVELTNDSIAK